MAEYLTGEATISSSGEVILPKEIHDSLNLVPGTKLTVLSDGENILLSPNRKLDISDLHEITLQALFANEDFAMKCVEQLKQTIDESMSISDIVSAFEKMCEKPIDNDMIVFETGTFAFSGEPLFHFSLFRLFPNNYDDEFFEVHLDVLFTPNSINQKFSFAIGDEQIQENIFEYIRNSEAFKYAESEAYQRVDIWMSET